MNSSIYKNSYFELSVDVRPALPADSSRGKSPSVGVSQSSIPAATPIEIVLCRNVLGIQPNQLAAHATVARQNPSLTSGAVHWVIEAVVIGFAAYGAAYCCMPLEQVQKDDSLRCSAKSR